MQLPQAAEITLHILVKFALLQKLGNISYKLDNIFSSNSIWIIIFVNINFEIFTQM